MERIFGDYDNSKSDVASINFNGKFKSNECISEFYDSTVYGAAFIRFQQQPIRTAKR